LLSYILGFHFLLKYKCNNPFNQPDLTQFKNGVQLRLSTSSILIK